MANAELAVVRVRGAVTTMGFHYRDLDDYSVALRSLRADADRLAISGRSRLVLTENQPYGECESSTAATGVRCRCIHSFHTDNYSAATNALIASLMGPTNVVNGIYAQKRQWHDACASLSTGVVRGPLVDEMKIKPSSRERGFIRDVLRGVKRNSGLRAERSQWRPSRPPGSRQHGRA